MEHSMARIKRYGIKEFYGKTLYEIDGFITNKELMMLIVLLFA